MAEPHPQSWGPSFSAVGHRHLHYQQVSSRCCCCWSESKLENPWVQEQNGSWYWMRNRGIWKKLEGWSWNFCSRKAYMQSWATDTEIKRVDVRLQGSLWMSKERCRAEVQSDGMADEDPGGLFWMSRDGMTSRWRSGTLLSEQNVDEECLLLCQQTKDIVAIKPSATAATLTDCVPWGNSG